MLMNFDSLARAATRLDGTSLRRFLLSSPEKIGPEDLRDAFTWATISFLIEGEFGKATGYDVARKLRGALWPVLCDKASAEALNGQPCPRRPLCLLDLLWNDPGKLPLGRQIPKPWVLRATEPQGLDGGAPRCLVQLVLFGLAAAFCEEVADVVAITIGKGLQVGRRHVSIKILEEEIVIDEGLDPFVATESLKISLLSPLKLSADGRASLDYTALLPTLIDRIDGLGRWHGAKLSCDFRQLREKARAITVNESQTEIGTWERRSGRSHRLVPMVDTRGTLRLSGDFSGLEDFLALMPIVHAGKDTRHGHGWCGVSAGRALVRLKHEKDVRSTK